MIMSDNFWHDAGLTVEAKAVAIYLIERCSDASDIRRVQVGIALKVGPEKLRRIFKELVSAGYLVEQQRRCKGQFAGRHSLTSLARSLVECRP